MAADDGMLYSSSYIRSIEDSMDREGHVSQKL